MFAMYADRGITPIDAAPAAHARWPLSPRQREFRSTAEAFAEADIGPIARVCDDERRLPMVMRVTSAAAAMLGSLGYTGQSEVEKLLRDARHVAIVERPEPIHKGDHLLPRSAARRLLRCRYGPSRCQRAVVNAVRTGPWKPILTVASNTSSRTSSMPFGSIQQ